MQMLIPCFCRVEELEKVRCCSGVPLPAVRTAHSLQRTALLRFLLFIVEETAPIELLAGFVVWKFALMAEESSVRLSGCSASKLRKKMLVALTNQNSARQFQAKPPCFHREPRLLHIKDNGDSNTHTAAIELLEVHITAFKAAEGCDEVIDDIPQASAPFKSTFTTSKSSAYKTWYIAPLRPNCFTHIQC